MFGCAHHISRIEKPMYGIADDGDFQNSKDSIFIFEETQRFGSKEKASQNYSNKGWQYLYSTSIGWSIPLYQYFSNPGKIKEAMINFNKAWLLDHHNPEAYWGMSLVMAQRDKNYIYAVELLEKAISCDSNRTRLWFDYGVSNLDVIQKSSLTDQMKIEGYRKNGIYAFNKVIHSDENEILKTKAKLFIEQMNENP